MPMQEMQETQALLLGREDPLEEGMAIHSSIFAGKSHAQRSLVGYGRKQRVQRVRNNYKQLSTQLM